eukprot:352672-Chlamydomonas_euryale.AAC.9
MFRTLGQRSDAVAACCTAAARLVLVARDQPQLYCRDAMQQLVRFAVEAAVHGHAVGHTVHTWQGAQQAFKLQVPCKAGVATHLHDLGTERRWRRHACALLRRADIVVHAAGTAAAATSASNQVQHVARLQAS